MGTGVPEHSSGDQKVNRQFTGIGSLLPLYGLKGLNSGWQTWQQVALPIWPFWLPLFSQGLHATPISFFLNFPPFLFDSSLYSKDIWDHFIFKTSLLPISFLFILWLLFLLHCYVQRLICLFILNNFYLFICECTHMCVCACIMLHMHTVSREVRRELWMWTEVMGSCQS